MKSIKPGRGPSLIGGCMSIFVGLFGVLWTVTSVCSIGNNIIGIFFALFGVFFVAISVISAVYNFKNANGKGRFSIYDITDEKEEPDPLNRHLRNYKHEDITKGISNSSFCPYCGTKVMDNFEYCNRCGKKLP